MGIFNLATLIPHVHTMSTPSMTAAGQMEALALYKDQTTRQFGLQAQASGTSAMYR